MPMSALNIRNVDKNLLVKLKVRAAQSGKTLREFVLSLLWKAAE